MAHPRDVRIAELQAQMEAAKAEIAQLKADEQTEKAELETGSALNFAAAASQSTGIGLDGERNDQGDFVEAEKGSGMDLSGQNKSTKREMTAAEKSLYDAVMADPYVGLTIEQQLTANGMSMQDFEDTGIPIVEKRTFPIDDTDDGKGKGMNFAAAAEDTESKMEDGEHGSGMNLSGVEIEEEVEEDKATLSDVTDKKPMNFAAAAGGDDEEMVTEKQIADPEDKIQGDAAPEEEKDTGGRSKPTEIENLRGEKAGWEMKEDSNFWSVNEKDPYWKTQEGYDEAVDLYGKKPSWLKEKDVATLVYNPSTGEYEEIEQEEFVDLSPKKRPKL